MSGRLLAPAVVVGALLLVLAAGQWSTRPSDAPPEASVLETAQSSSPPAPVPRDTSARPAPSSRPGTDPEAEEASPSEVELLRPDAEGAPLTVLAGEEPDMSEMEGGVAEYDARIEARQRFRDFELTAIAARPLTPEKWRAIQADRGEEALDILKRAKQLTEEGEPEAARELMEEWQRLTSIYKNEAYGRGRVLGAE